MKEFLDMYQNLNKDNIHLLKSFYVVNLQFIDPAIEIKVPEQLSAYFAALYQNVESLAISIEAVLPLLRRGPFPHLAVVGSSAAYLPLPRAEAYGSSKAAVAYTVETLRVPLSKKNIAVSLICSGFVKTRLTYLNDFPMPFRITPEEASDYILKGFARKKAEIHFPKRFTYILKLLSFLPRPLWNKIAEQMVKI